MAIELISKIKPKNGGTFKLVDASDVDVGGGVGLDEVLEGLGSGGGSGQGDMLKSVYDTDGDGVIDRAKTADTATRALDADTAGQASNAAKLGNQLPSYYASASILQDLSDTIVGTQDWDAEENTGATIAGVIGPWKSKYGTNNIANVIGPKQGRLQNLAITDQLRMLYDMLQATAVYITFSVGSWKTGAPKNTTWQTYLSCDTEVNYEYDMQIDGNTIVNADGDCLYLNTTLVKPTDIIQDGKTYTFK